MLNGLFDIYNRLEYLTENGDILQNLKKLVKWEDFRGELEVIYDSPYSFADRTCLRSHTPASRRCNSANNRNQHGRSETWITQHRIQHGQILHFDAAECIKRRFL